ncbi:hypothetical protein ACA910_019990 [Epithemia clementina (nom. ined.)]
MGLDSDDDDNSGKDVSEASSIVVKSDDSNDEDFRDDESENEASQGDDYDDDNDGASYVAERHVSSLSPLKRRGAAEAKRKRPSASSTNNGHRKQTGLSPPKQRCQRSTSAAGAAATSKKRTTPRKRPHRSGRSPKRQRRLSNDTDISSSDLDLPDDEDEEGGIKFRNTRKAQKRRSPRQRNGSSMKSVAEKVEDDQDSDVDDGSLTLVKGRKTSKRRVNTRSAAKARCRSKVWSDCEDADSSCGDDDAATTFERTPTTGRKQRTSARKANKSLSKHAKLDAAASDDDDAYSTTSDVNGEDTIAPRTCRAATKASRRRSRDDDDDDFVAEDDDDDEDPESELDGDTGSDEEEGKMQPRIKQNKESVAVDIDKEQIGTNDDSSIDDASPTKQKQLSPVLREISPSQKGADNLDIDESSVDERINNKCSPIAKAQACPSTHDLITEEILPRRHVCFITAGGSRQCFALSTLHKIATSSALTKYCVDIAGQQKKTFFQPPHFRSEMSDDLLDQIASRFGREALEIDGPFYKERILEIEQITAQGGNSGNSDHEDVVLVETSDSPQNFSTRSRRLSNAIVDNGEFLNRVQQYMKSQMGSQDLYVCPVCYSVAQARFRKHSFFAAGEYNEDEEVRNNKAKGDRDIDDQQLEEKYLSGNLQDPMAVLQSLDNSYSREFEIASAFCRKKASEIKVHIRDDHGLDTKVIEGNGLYSRFKIRGQDGLLQRYLNTHQRQFGQGQGAMQRYWFWGNNFYFVHLLTLVQRAQIMADVKNAGDDDDVDKDEKEEAKNYWLAPTKFFSSFENIKDRLWEILSGPYRKGNKQDLNGWIADENENDNDQGFSHRALFWDSIRKREADQAQAERELVQRYQEEIRGDEDSYEEVEDDESYDDRGGKNDHYDEDGDESDDADEWEQHIREKRRVRSPDDKKKPFRRATMNKGVLTPRRKLRMAQIGDDNNDDSSDPEIDWESNRSAAQEPAATSTSGKKRRVLDEDEDEDYDHSVGVRTEATCLV